MANNTNFILTGATGVLGSHVFYELLLIIHRNNYDGKLVLLVRSKKEKTYIQRFEELFGDKLLPDYVHEVDLERIKVNNITLIDFDLDETPKEDIKKTLNTCKFHLIHCAASVNLGNNTTAYEEIKKTNYDGTLNLIEALKDHLHKVSYISSAFAFRQLEEGGNELDYRNHYEQFKAIIEKEVFRKCEASGIDCQVLRPSIICGRLVDYPHHVIGRFLVFYLFGAFFYRIKQSTYSNLPLRITINPNSGLNIIPVDYTAKAIVRAMATDIKELNIVSSKYVPNTFTIPSLLKEVGWHNFEFVYKQPEDLNAAEKLYYRSVGPQLSNYLMAPDYDFDMDVLGELMKDIPQPDIYNHFEALCKYAVEQEFTNLLT